MIDVTKTITRFTYNGTEIPMAGGGGELNIAYGLTPPEDTSKLWVKTANEPSKVLLKHIDGTEDGAILETLSATLSAGLYGVACGVVGTKCYLFGGFSAYSPNYRNTIQVFDTETNTITTLSTTLPIAASQMACGVVGTKCYLFGGDSANGRLSGIYAFDTETNTITTLSFLYTGAWAKACGVVGTKCYLFGGYGNNYLTTIDVFDTETNTISTLTTTLPTGARNIACGVVGTKCYLFGGQGSSSLNTIRVFDTETNTITTLSTTLPIAASQMACGVVGTKCYLFGGWGSSSLNTIRVFDTETNTITTLSTTLPASASEIACGVVGTKCYLFGGKVNGIGQFSIQQFSTTKPLANNLLEIFHSDSSRNLIKLIDWTDVEGVFKLYSILIGNNSNIAEQVEAAIYDNINWVNLDGTINMEKLYVPTASLSGGNYLYITNNSRNNGYSQGYKLYSGETLLTTITSSSMYESVDLETILSTTGTYNISVAATGTGYEDSDKCEAISVTAYSITNVLTNASANANNASAFINKNNSTTLTYTANSGCSFPSTINVTGATYSWNAVTGALTLSQATDSITITIVAEETSDSVVIFESEITVTQNGTPIASGDTVTSGTVLTVSVPAFYSSVASLVLYANSVEIARDSGSDYVTANYTVQGNVEFTWGWDY